MPQVAIPYGAQEIAFEIPDANFQEILAPNMIQLPRNQIAEVKQALNNPIGTGQLKTLIHPGQKIAILCDDISRLTPTREILPLIIDEINRAGGADEQIFIIMALGSHRPMTEAEIEHKVGSDIRRRIPVYNSEFRDKKRLADLGIAPGGVHVWADKRAMEADVRIGIGSIVPHPAVGWSGGGKIIYPGITGEETVAAFHLQHGKVHWNMFGSVKSPVRENMEQWVEQVGLHFILNVICTPDGRIYKAVAGHYRQAHRAGVEYAKEIYGVKAGSRVEIAVVSSHPADGDFWQATKGVLAGDFLVKDGGTLILVTPCPEGVGPHPDYTDWIGNPELESYLANPSALKELGGDPLAAPVAATVARIGKRINLALVSEGISQTEASKAGFLKFGTLSEAINDAIARYPSPKISIIPYGAETFPVFE